MAKRVRSLRKIPPFIHTRLDSIGNEFQIAVVKRISLAEIQTGSFNHVGLHWANNQLTTSGPTMPPHGGGRYAGFNIAGQEIVRRDLPKVDKTITFVNNCLFGEPGRRATITQIRSVYPRERIAPRNLEITCKVLASSGEEAILSFRISRPYSLGQQDLGRELLFGLNLLQEAVGGVNVFPLSATTSDFLGSIQVHWEILPAGERERNISLIVSSFRPHTQQDREELERRAQDRYSFFESLNPEYIVRGTGGMSGYMGALIQNKIVVFEHLSPGNGVYILFGDWEEQSQRTKTDLLQNAEEGKEYIRVTHTGDWKVRVRSVISERLQ